jgi:hypothetical protein
LQPKKTLQKADLNTTGKTKSKSYMQMKATGEEYLIAPEDPDEITKKGQYQPYIFVLPHFPIYTQFSICRLACPLSASVVGDEMFNFIK